MPAAERRPSLLRHASTVASLTLVSRVLGFARDAAVAALFGTGVVADASVAGLAIPQLARRLLGEGALNAAILPRLPPAGGGDQAGEPGPPVSSSEEAAPSYAVPQGGASQDGAPHDGDPGDRAFRDPARLAGALILVFTLSAGFVALLLALFMPAVTAALAPGFLDDPARALGAVLAGRLAMVCLPLATAAGVVAALVNATGRVTRPAFAPAAGNIAVLVVIGLLALLGTGHGSGALVWLAVAAVAGAIAQFVVIGIACPYPLARLRPDRAALAAALPMLVAAAPTLLAASLPQLRFLVANAAGSGIDGGVAALFYATRLVELPLGLVGASAGAVLLPALAREGRRAAGEQGLLAALLLTAPAAVGLFLLAEPIVRVLFARGAFGAEATALTAQALAMLALSLPVQAMERILSTIAFAEGFGRIVTRASVAGLVIGGAGGFLALDPLGLAGPALGVLASSLVTLVGLWAGLARAGRLRIEAPALRRLAGCLAATALMGLAVAGGAHLLGGSLDAGGLKGAGSLAALVVLGLVSYGLAAMTLGLLPGFRRRRA